MNNTPLLIRPGAAQEIAGYTLAAARHGVPAARPTPRVLNLPGAMVAERGFEHCSPTVYRVGASASVIQVDGPMWYSISPWCAYYGGSSIPSFIHALNRVTVDDTVSDIILDISTPGGDACPLADMADAVRRAKAAKNVWVRFYGAYSMGVAAGCLGDEISMSPGTMMGSIGSIAYLWDDSEALAKDGVRVLAVSTGKEKLKWAPGQPLGESAREAMQRTVDRCGQDFFELVREGRGIDVETIRSWDGREFFAEEARDLGLIDTVETEFEFYSRVIAGAKPVRRKASQTTTKPGRVAPGNSAGGARGTKGAPMTTPAKPTAPANPAAAPKNGAGVARNGTAEELLDSIKSELKLDDETVNAIAALVGTGEEKKDETENRGGAPLPANTGPRATMEQLEDIVPKEIEGRDGVIMGLYRGGATPDRARAEVQSRVLTELKSLREGTATNEATRQETAGYSKGRAPVPGANRSPAGVGNAVGEWDAAVTEVMNTRKLPRHEAVQVVRAERPELVQRYVAERNQTGQA